MCVGEERGEGKAGTGGGRSRAQGGGRPRREVGQRDSVFAMRSHAALAEVLHHGSPGRRVEVPAEPCGGVLLAGGEVAGKGDAVRVEKSLRALVLGVTRPAADQAWLRCGDGKRGGGSNDWRCDWDVELAGHARLAGGRGCRGRADWPTGPSAGRWNPTGGGGVFAAVPAHVIQQAAGIGPKAGSGRVIEQRTVEAGWCPTRLRVGRARRWRASR